MSKKRKSQKTSADEPDDVIDPEANEVEDIEEIEETPKMESYTATAGMPAADRLEQLEVKLFGAVQPRIDGQIERGHGSLFKRLSEEDQARYVALEREVAAEAKLAEAKQAVCVAELELKEASEAVKE